MSIRVMTKVWDHSAAGGAELLVLLSIADQCHGDDNVWYCSPPSHDDLVKKCRLPKKTIAQLIYSLKTRGELTTKNRSRHVEYTVLPAIATDATVKSKECAGVRKSARGFVYLLQCGPYYKIGISTQVDKRVEQLSTIPPFDVELIHTIPTTDMRALEADLHGLYALKRKNGEWFELEPSDVEYIKGLN